MCSIVGQIGHAQCTLLCKSLTPCMQRLMELLQAGARPAAPQPAVRLTLQPLMGGCLAVRHPAPC